MRQTRRIGIIVMLLLQAIGPTAAFAAPEAAGCADIRPALVAAAAIMKDRYVVPATGRAAAETLIADVKRGEGEHVCGGVEVQALRLTQMLRSAAPDWHLRVAAGPPPPTSPAPDLASASTEPDDHGVTEVSRLAGGIGYLRISGFDDIHQAEPRIAHAIALLADVKGMIIDVRGNRGGDGDTMELILRSFLPRQAPETMIKLDRTGKPVEHAPPEPRWDRFAPAVKVAVLVDRASASAAEALAFGLREEVGATIVGNRSLGAAHEVDDALGLPGGFALFVPEFRVAGRKSGKDWEQTGVVPDIEAEGPDALLLAWEAVRRSKSS